MRFLSLDEWFQYSHRRVTGWAWDRADYNVVFKNRSRVVEYGTGEVRVKQNAIGPMNGSFLFICRSSKSLH